MDLDFEINLGPLRESLRALPDALDDTLESAVRVSAQLVAERSRAEHPYTDRTGALTRRTRAHAPRGRFTRGDLRGEIVADTLYASYVERGTSRSRPYPYLGPALEFCRPEIEHRIDNAVEIALRRAGF